MCIFFLYYAEEKIWWITQMVFFFNTGTRTSIRLCSTKLEIFQKIWPYCWCIQTPSVCISAILKISLEKQNERIAADHRQIKNIRFYHILLYIRRILNREREKNTSSVWFVCVLFFPPFDCSTVPLDCVVRESNHLILAIILRVSIQFIPHSCHLRMRIHITFISIL